MLLLWVGTVLYFKPVNTILLLKELDESKVNLANYKVDETRFLEVKVV